MSCFINYLYLFSLCIYICGALSTGNSLVSLFSAVLDFFLQYPIKLFFFQFIVVVTAIATNINLPSFYGALLLLPFQIANPWCSSRATATRGPNRDPSWPPTVDSFGAPSLQQLHLHLSFIFCSFCNLVLCWWNWIALLYLICTALKLFCAEWKWRVG